MTISPAHLCERYALKYWPYIARHISWSYKSSRSGLDLFEATKGSASRVKIIFRVQPDLEDLSRFRFAAEEACRAANEILRENTHATRVWH